MKLISFNLCIIIFLSILISPACKKSEKNNITTADTIVKAPVVPATAATIGFFLENWQPKQYVAPSFTAATIPTSSVTSTVTVDASNVITKIPVTIFGHNANIWMTPMVNQPQFLSQTSDLNPHVLRFPSGSGSDCYFWNDSIQPPADAPQYLITSSGTQSSSYPYSYGRNSASGEATLDNYYSVLKTTNCVGMLTVNYGYARYGTGPTPAPTAAHLAADWVRYDNGRTKYWEIGNENYGTWEWGYDINTATNQDGQPQYLTGQLYGQHFQIFYDSMKNAAASIGQTIYIGAVEYESEPQSWNVNTTKTWNSGMIPAAGNKPDFYIGHNYFTPYNVNSSASVILNCADSVPATMIKYMTSQVIQYGGIIKPTIMGEWNLQGNSTLSNFSLISNVSGSFAVIVQGEDIKNLYGLSARWDLYNGWGAGGNDMGLYSDVNQPGVPQWTPRPSFYYMYYFQKTIGDMLVGDSISGNKAIKVYASTYSTNGQAGVAVVNTSGTTQVVEINFKNYRMGTRYYWWELAGGTDNGNFSLMTYINGNGPTLSAGGPSNYSSILAKSALTSGGIKVSVAPYSADFILVDASK